MYLSSSEQLRKIEKELPHECFIQSLSTLWEGIIETVVNSLRDYIVEPFEKLLFVIVCKSFIFDQGKRYEVGCNSIEEKLLVLLKLGLWVEDLAYYEPEAV